VKLPPWPGPGSRAGAAGGRSAERRWVLGGSGRCWLVFWSFPRKNGATASQKNHLVVTGTMEFD